MTGRGKGGKFYCKGLAIKERVVLFIRNFYKYFFQVYGGRPLCKGPAIFSLDDSLKTNIMQLYDNSNSIKKHI